jgi:type I restriction enzyme R subunit
MALNEPVNIFDEDQFAQLKEARGVAEGASTSALADAIAHATKRVITERMDEDPALFAKFSEMIQQAIDDFLARRLSETEYLETVVDIRERVVARKHDDVPERIRDDEATMAYFGVVKQALEAAGVGTDDLDDICAGVAEAARSALATHKKVRFWEDLDVQKRVEVDLDDYLFDEVRSARGIELPPVLHDEVIAAVMRVARSRASR